MAKVKTLSEFQKIKIGDEILFDGDLYIVSDVGIHFDRNYIELSSNVSNNVLGRISGISSISR